MIFSFVQCNERFKRSCSISSHLAFRLSVYGLVFRFGWAGLGLL